MGADSGTGERQASGRKEVGLDRQDGTSQPLLGLYVAPDHIIYHRSLGNFGALENVRLLILTWSSRGCWQYALNKLTQVDHQELEN